ncbi:MAG: hypothetical protein N3A60_12480, partial [Thermanaerothrix sp.]|nr:hypothetical protein [Thermanaerothrix sp.]
KWAERMAHKCTQLGLEEDFLPLLALATFTCGLSEEHARDYVGKELPEKRLLENILGQPIDTQIPAI